MFHFFHPIYTKHIKPMKITKTELLQIIKEEAGKLKKKSALIAERAEIQKQLNESELDELSWQGIKNVGKTAGGMLGRAAGRAGSAVANKVGQAGSAVAGAAKSAGQAVG